MGRALLINGWDVAVFDPDPEAERKDIPRLLGEWPAGPCPGLYERALPPEGPVLTYHYRLGRMARYGRGTGCRKACPERLELKPTRCLSRRIKWRPAGPPEGAVDRQFDLRASSPRN